MTEGTNTLGRILISPRAIETIAAQAALALWGGRDGPQPGQRNRQRPRQRPEGRRGGAHQRLSTEIDLYVIVEQGTRITVARRCQHRPLSAEKALDGGGRITVTVRDLHVSDADQAGSVSPRRLLEAQGGGAFRRRLGDTARSTR
jgi:hypothetical protein